MTESPGEPATQTETAQITLILERIPEAKAYPPDWETTGGVSYLYREGTLLVRDGSAASAAEALQGLELENVRIVNLPGSLSRLTWTTAGEGTSVPEVLARLTGREGPLPPGIVAPDHLLYVCVHACAATEPELVDPGTPVVPRPQTGEHAAQPGSRRGRRVEVVLVDTGLVPQATTDSSWLAGVTGDIEHQADPSGGLGQDAGHGTFTAGCVRVTAPEAEVHVVDGTVASPDWSAQQDSQDVDTIGAAFESALAAIIRRTLLGRPTRTVRGQARGGRQAGVPDVLVLNFAGRTADDIPPVALSLLYEEVLQHQTGLLVLAPAGNDGDERQNWPAAFEWAVAVGALDSTWGDRAPWSTYGHHVDVHAPGADLVNAYAYGTYTYRWEGPKQGTQEDFAGMARWSGTSFATPLVAGLVASRMSTTGQSAPRAWSSLLDLAERQAIPGVGPVLFPGQGSGWH